MFLNVTYSEDIICPGCKHRFDNSCEFGGVYAFDVFLVPRRGYVPNGLAEQLEVVNVSAEIQKTLIRNKTKIILDALESEKPDPPTPVDMDDPKFRKRILHKTGEH